MKSKNYKIKKLYLSLGKLCFLFLILCFINILLSFENIDFTSAVSYKSSTNVQFTFNPTLSLSISSADLIISNLAPGSSADSNEITVGISTNASYGYYLSATVGTAETGETYHTRNLVNGNNVFNSLATTDNISSMSLAGDNTWGYAFATYDNTNSTWNSYSNYSGLPLDNDDNGETGAKLIETENASDSRNIKFKIGAKASSSQIAGEYTNVVNFYAVTNPTPDFLYYAVRSMSKGKQTINRLQATITTPTSTNPAEDTSNSGVFEYDPNVFGASSDASNDYTIYYYRGILDTSEGLGTYGSDGQANAYPNYVILDADGNRTTDDTCWRIVRTTGSGGVKMIYNGKWTGSTCAHSTTYAQVTTQAFAAKGTSAQSTYWLRNIHYVGYTFNNSMTDLRTATSVDTVFGSDANPALNNTRSNIKTYIEDTWYANNMTTFTNMLESSAGYCNDRTAYSDAATSTALTSITPYASSGTMYFGAYGRNYNSAKTPSLNCPRNTVDLYRYVANSTGLSNELKYPVALLTADEASFAGSGSSTATNGSTYNAKSYLRSGSDFWLLSPNVRDSYGYAIGFNLYSSGFLDSSSVNISYGVRPAISLKPGTIITGGNGTATNPWTVE